MTVTRKIPRHVARELARHVKKSTPQLSSPPPSSSSSKNKYWYDSKSNNVNTGKLKTVAACFAFVGITAQVPLWAMKWIGPLNEKDGALTGSQIRRGAFNNSGSRDVGKDPNWDFRTGTRKKDKEYVDLFLKDNPREIDHGDHRYDHRATNTRKGKQ
mmetsp:Transcript_8415/g.12647  ORF Transcript_8415/g.12647 Transcript_8415/m.12647 type:complete len:157 (-) Transcript_8415:64-534(-)